MLAHCRSLSARAAYETTGPRTHSRGRRDGASALGSLACSFSIASHLLSLPIEGRNIYRNFTEKNLFSPQCHWKPGKLSMIGSSHVPGPDPAHAGEQLVLVAASIRAARG